jgi:hypothetical protein
VLERFVRATGDSPATRRRAAEALATFAPDARITAILSAVSDGTDQGENEKALLASLSRDSKAVSESLADTMLRTPARTASEHSLKHSLQHGRAPIRCWNL